MFLDRLVPSVYAIAISVSAVLIFGEIVPQAVMMRYSFELGAFFSPVVWILMFVTFLIAKPIALLLDCILGHEHGEHKFETKRSILYNPRFSPLHPSNCFSHVCL